MNTIQNRSADSLSARVRHQLKGFSVRTIVAIVFTLRFTASAAPDFKLADGFEISLFASETNGVVKPIQMRFDYRGRLWAIGSTVYPQIEPGQTPDDKVLILEDTDHDGRCDKTTIFARGLMIPTGLEVVKDGAYIGHGPELLFLKDTDGDGKADERKVVLRGFGTGDNHQNINSFLWGPSGELWMSQGLHIHSNVETPWGLIRMEKAGIWRFWPKRLKLEAFYGAEHEPQNPWGFVFTDWGEPIVLAGNNSSPIYPVPGLVSRRKVEPPPLIWRNGNGRKVSGGDIVGTTHFPDEWQGKLILGGYINNAVWSLSILEDGAGFALEDFKPLITTTNRTFRPVDAKFGPEGALYICDWYNPIIGHYQASFRHPDRDKTHGRIWRVTAKGRPFTKPPDLTAGDLLQYLDSPDRWTRQFAKRALAEINAGSGGRQRWSGAVGQSVLASELSLKELLGVSQSHEIVATDLLERLTDAKNPGARAYAASVVGSWADRLTNALALLRPLASDPHPRVRLQAIVASTYVASSDAIDIAAIASQQPTDRFLEYALNQAVYALKPFWLPTLKPGPHLRMLVQRDRTPDTLAALREMPRDTAVVELLAEVGVASDLAELLKPGTPEALRALAQTARSRSTRPSGDLATTLRPLLRDTNAIALAGIWKVTALRDALRKTDAIEALADLGDEEAILSYASRSNTTAIAMLTRFDLPKAAALAPGVLNEQIVAAFLQRKGGAAALADSLSAHPPNKENAEMILRLMNASGRRDEKLAAIVSPAAFGVPPLGGSAPRFSATDLIPLVRSKGNAKHGEEIYRRPELGCVACHSVHGQGGIIGPDLSALGTAQPLDFIIGAILDPQKEIKEGFVSVSIVTTDGEELQGYLRRESAEDFTIRDVLQNRDVRLPRSRVKERRQTGSVMPIGLVDSLQRDDFVDLLRFLSELGIVSK